MMISGVLKSWPGLCFEAFIKYQDMLLLNGPGEYAGLLLKTVLFALGILPVSYSLAQNDSKIISTIKQLEIDWHHAYITHGSNMIKRILADDFINLGRTGLRATKQQTFENFKKDSSVYE